MLLCFDSAEFHICKSIQQLAHIKLMNTQMRPSSKAAGRTFIAKLCKSALIEWIHSYPSVVSFKKKKAESFWIKYDQENVLFFNKTIWKEKKNLIWCRCVQMVVQG